MEEKYVILLISLALIIGAIIGGTFMSQKLTFERDLYINRMYDKDRIINVWEERATNNLKLIKNYCDELKDSYAYVQFNMSDCEIYQTQQGDSNVICEKSKSLFVITN